MEVGPECRNGRVLVSVVDPNTSRLVVMRQRVRRPRGSVGMLTVSPLLGGSSFSDLSY